MLFYLNRLRCLCFLFLCFPPFHIDVFLCAREVYQDKCLCQTLMTHILKLLKILKFKVDFIVRKVLHPCMCYVCIYAYSPFCYASWLMHTPSLDCTSMLPTDTQKSIHQLLFSRSPSLILAIADFKNGKFP